jgi:NitT/TauT family transport system permease protein
MQFAPRPKDEAKHREPTAMQTLASPARSGPASGISRHADGWLRHLPALRSFALPVGTAVSGLFAWEIIVKAAKIHPVILPPPSLVIEKFFKFFPLIFQNAVPTTLESVSAFLLASLLGVALAMTITYSSLLRQALYPNIVLFQLIPKIALAPLFIIWLGVGHEARLTFSLFITFFPMLVSTAAGLENVDPDMIRLCRSVGASKWQIMMRVRFPTSIPFIFSGMKISITLAVIGVVVGEFITSQAGLGYLILFASSRQETALTLAAVFMLCIVGLLLYGSVALCERLTRRWYS